MEYAGLSKAVEEYVVQVFRESADRTLIFHNIMHTSAVVLHAMEIGAFYLLPGQDLFILTTAAWFHDAGYLRGVSAGHEQRGAEMAADFLNHKGVSGHIIQSVQTCILATRLPQCPVSLLAEILCDADLYHFGTQDLFIRDKLMKKEVEARTGKPVSEAEWIRSTIDLLESHHYHTLYCRQLLGEPKQRNLHELRSFLGEVC